MRRVLVLTVAMAVMMGLALPASATPPSGVTIEVETDLTSPFTASGPAVTDGVVCESGLVEDVFFKATGFQSNRGVNFQIVKNFACDDNSGDFSVKLQVRLLFDGSPATFNWNVVDGTGAYENLHGTGTGVGLDCATCFVLDVYSGGLHIDP